jgi:hypothetical protein
MSSVMNVTNGIDGLSSMATMGPIGSLLVTGGIFVGVLIMIFLLSKNFRQFVYGGVITGLMLINFIFSRWVGKSAVENNFEPLKWVGSIMGFIILSIGLGHIFLRTKWGKKLEKKIEK